MRIVVLEPGAEEDAEEDGVAVDEVQPGAVLQRVEEDVVVALLWGGEVAADKGAIDGVAAGKGMRIHTTARGFQPLAWNAAPPNESAVTSSEMPTSVRSLTS